MKVFEKKLYEELRDIERQMVKKLNHNLIDEKIKNYVIAELNDVKSTLQKLESGEYGKCEVSGELIPFDLLRTLPTAKTINDFKEMKGYYKKTQSY